MNDRITAIQAVINEWAGPFPTGSGMTEDAAVQQIRSIIEAEAAAPALPRTYIDRIHDAKDRLLAEALPASALDVERLARHYPLRIDAAGYITCACDAIIDEYDNGWWRHVAAEYARLAHPDSDGAP